MNLTQTPTANQWLASVFRSIANKVEGATIAAPTAVEITREHLRAAQLALLDAEAEAERFTHTAAMLRKRILRLSGAQ